MSEIEDAGSAVGLGCALESFAEVDEVKGKVDPKAFRDRP